MPSLVSMMSSFRVDNDGDMFPEVLEQLKVQYVDLVSGPNAFTDPDAIEAAVWAAAVYQKQEADRKKRLEGNTDECNAPSTEHMNQEIERWDQYAMYLADLINEGGVLKGDDEDASIYSTDPPKTSPEDEDKSIYSINDCEEERNAGIIASGSAMDKDDILKSIARASVQKVELEAMRKTFAVDKEIIQFFNLIVSMIEIETHKIEFPHDDFMTAPWGDDSIDCMIGYGVHFKAYIRMIHLLNNRPSETADSVEDWRHSVLEADTTEYASIDDVEEGGFVAEEAMVPSWYTINSWILNSDLPMKMHAHTTKYLSGDSKYVFSHLAAEQRTRAEEACKLIAELCELCQVAADAVKTGRFDGLSEEIRLLEAEVLDREGAGKQDGECECKCY